MGEDEPEPGLREEALVDGLKLVGQGANPRERDREVGIEGVREPDPHGFESAEHVASRQETSATRGGLR